MTPQSVLIYFWAHPRILPVLYFLWFIPPGPSLSRLPGLSCQTLILQVLFFILTTFLHSGEHGLFKLKAQVPASLDEKPHQGQEGDSGPGPSWVSAQDLNSGPPTTSPIPLGPKLTGKWVSGVSGVLRKQLVA